VDLSDDQHLEVFRSLAPGLLALRARWQNSFGNSQRASFSRSRYQLITETHLARYTKRLARFNRSNADLLMSALIVKLPAHVLELGIHPLQFHDRSAAAVEQNGRQVVVEFPAFDAGQQVNLDGRTEIGKACTP
jgi:hypothetical protein